MTKNSEQVLKNKIHWSCLFKNVKLPMLMAVKQYIIQHIIKSAIKLTIKSSEKGLK